MSNERVPVGKSLDLSDDALAALAQVSPQDIAEAQAAWRNEAPPEFRSLLDATPADG